MRIFSRLWLFQVFYDYRVLLTKIDLKIGHFRIKHASYRADLRPFQSKMTILKNVFEYFWAKTFKIDGKGTSATR